MQLHAGFALVAVSFHRPFLDGLHPGRARFRVGGSLPVRRPTKPLQSRTGKPVTRFSCLNTEVQAAVVNHKGSLVQSPHSLALELVLQAERLGRSR